MKKLLISLLSLAFFGAAAILRAEESPGDHKLSEWSFGKVLFGEKFSKKRSQGQSGANRELGRTLPSMHRCHAASRRAR